MIPNASQKSYSLLRFCHIFTILIFTILLCSTVSSVEIAPKKEIVVVGDESQKPEWKRRWDSGREYTRNQQYEEAIPHYLAVLKQKPHIEEVKWELCRVYMEIARYDDASLILESLLESNPDRIEYLLSAGDIALADEKQNQAVLFFGRALEQDPGSKYYSRALAGMIDALVGQGRSQIAIPLMEQLYQSGDTTPELLENLAHALSRAGDLKKSGYYYRELIEKYRISPSVMRQASYIFEKLDDIDSAADLWERYLVEVPESHYLRQKLTEYYLSRSNYRQAYPHLIVLLDNDINRETYLLQAGRINLTEFGRADKALSYFESYYAEFPDGEDVSEEIGHIKVILANDLLSIVENAGVWMLWTDLSKITTDRLGIYLAMADILEALGKDKELLEVLQIINIHKPEDLEIRLRLASLYYKKNLYQPCLETLSREKNYEYLTADYFRLRMSCEKAMNDIPALMSSYKEYLDFFPDDSIVGKQALQLAGEIGDYTSLRELLKVLRENSVKKQQFSPVIIKTAINAFVQNRLYSEADQFISDLQKRKEYDEATEYNLMRELARIKYLQGKKFASEQELRIAAVKSQGDINVILDLTANALKNNDLMSTQVWMPIARKTINSVGKEKDLADEKSALLYYSLMLDQLSGDMESMRERAEKYIKSINGKTHYRKYDREILKMLIRYYFQDRSITQYRNIVSSYFTPPLRGWIAAELLVLANILENGDKKIPLSKGIRIRSTGDLFELYDIFMYLNATTRSEQLLDYLNDRLGESVRLEASRAELYIEQYEFAKAAQKYRELSEQFPGEEYFYSQMVKYEEYSGKTISFKDSSAAEPAVMAAGTGGERKAKDTPEYDLEKARSLWLEDKEDEALSIYNKLEITLRNSVQDVLKIVEDSPEYQPDESGFFWSGLTDGEEDIDILDHIMNSSFFSSHLGDKIGIKSAETYEDYRWLKIVSKEQKAKKALNRKEFYQAEKRYQELLEEEKVESVNVYTDLATVYNRLGRHAKETELLEKIKHEQIVYPQLQSVVEKNINRRRPQLFIDGLFRKEDGRDGDIDIKQQYFGLGLKIQPTLYQEIGFKAGRNIYGNRLDSSLLTSNKLSAHHSIFFTEEIELTSRIGFEDMKEEGNAYFLYDITLTGKLADSVEGYLSIDQNLVSDTIDSLAQGIYKRDYRVGLNIDYIPRFFLGFDVILRDYNDDNDGRKINLWSSYRIFSDVNTFELTYDYEKLENKIDSTPTPVVDGGVEKIDLGYWSPGSFWKHSLTAKLRRELWPPGKRQSGKSFISAQYGIGYESGDNFVQRFGIDILLEINTPFLLKGTFVSDWSDDYNRKEAYAAIIYRW